jgi:hypothetical protein
MSFAEKVFQLSEPRAVATGPILNFLEGQPDTEINGRLSDNSQMNRWPVATASGSDTALPTRLFTNFTKSLAWRY